jgi:hypothetical protein
MSKIVRHEFMGNWLLFWFLCIFGVTLPIAILYLLVRTVRLETELDDPEGFVQEFRAGKLTAK